MSSSLGERRVLGLPPGFLFGTSTASYQIEGAATEDGKGPSIWDTFTAEPGRVVDGSSGDVACDHYHRWPEDVELMARLGADGYRFSIAWPRIQPTGQRRRQRGGSGLLRPPRRRRCSRPASSRWRRSTTGTCRRRWRMPGVWLDRDTALRFGEYAAVVAERLGDRVAHWCPVNEPNVVTLLGYAQEEMAPARGLTLRRPPGGPPPPPRARPRGAGAASHRRPARWARRPTTSTVWPATRERGGPWRRPGLVRRPVEPALRRPDAARPLPGGRSAT